MDKGTFNLSPDEARNAPVYGALTQVGAPADTRRVVPGLEYNLEKQNKLIDEFYAPRVKMYEDLTAKIAARRAGPPLSERLAQLSAALAQPTKYSGPGNMFGAISSVYADQQKAQREERLANEDLATKYQMARMGEEESQFVKRMTAAEKMRALQLQYLTKTGKKPTLSRPVIVPGGMTDNLGRPIRAPVQGDIDILVGRPDREQAIIDFNKRYRAGAAEEILQQYGLERYDDTPGAPTAEGDE
jgi:hypothetical protein